MLKKRKRIFFVPAIVILIILLLSQCVDKKEERTDIRGTDFAGAAACNNCHSNIYNSYTHTAHFQSTTPASAATIKGNFSAPNNQYYYRPHIKVVLEKRDSGFFQVAYKNDVEKQANRFDVVVGSGRKAQTYLYWYGQNMYELPVSWFVPAQSWANSPGYPPHQVRFDRNIPIGCFECHSSYIKKTGTEVAGQRVIDNFDAQKIIYGIDCERCHGPAAQHVSFHQEHPQEKSAKYIARYASLSRQAKIDMCAQCHSGIQQTLKSTFNFKPGDTLINNFFAPYAQAAVAEIDVHGNQKQLLTSSACYLKTQTLTCTSCHNTHVTDRNNMELFSQRCITCHKNTEHNFGSMDKSVSASIISNCIDCHMPNQPSKSITLLSNGQTSPTPNLVRTHYITIYPEATKNYLRSLPKQ